MRINVDAAEPPARAEVRLFRGPIDALGVPQDQGWVIDCTPTPTPAGQTTRGRLPCALCGVVCTASSETTGDRGQLHCQRELGVPDEPADHPLMRPHIDWSPTVEAADWLVPRLHGLGVDTGSLVPVGYGAYLRLLHPAWSASPAGGMKVRWAELARRAGVALTATTQYQQVDRGRPAGVRPPDPGTLAPDELAVLVEVLAGHTTQPDRCWFAVWDGYGWMTGGAAVAALAPGGGESAPPFTSPPPPARMRLPGRTLALYRGGIDAAALLCREPPWQSPNLWWPEDHAWCVSSDIDLRATYLAGSDALARALEVDDRIEVVRVGADDPVAG